MYSYEILRQNPASEPVYIDAARHEVQSKGADHPVTIKLYVHENEAESELAGEYFDCAGWCRWREGEGEDAETPAEE